MHGYIRYTVVGEGPERKPSSGSTNFENLGVKIFTYFSFLWSANQYDDRSEISLLTPGSQNTKPLIEGKENEFIFPLLLNFVGFFKAGLY